MAYQPQLVSLLQHQDPLNGQFNATFARKSNFKQRKCNQFYAAIGRKSATQFEKALGHYTS